MKIICVDFDGVIFRREGPWVSPLHFNGQIVTGTVAALIKLAAARYHVVIHTSRALNPVARAAVKAWCDTHGLRGLYASITARKVGAHAYIDDRAVSFTGDWPAAIQAAASMVPWTDSITSAAVAPLVVSAQSIE